MTPFQTGVTIVGLLACAAALFGLVYRGYVDTCRSFAVYLAFMILTGTLIAMFPSVFFTQRFWLAKEVAMLAIELAIVAEIGWWIFLGFPGAARTVRGLVLMLLVATFLAVVFRPAGDSSGFLLGALRARVGIGAAWMFGSMAGMALYYDIPVRPIHRAVLMGMGLHYFVFGVMLQMIADSGLLGLDQILATAQQTAFVAITVMWAVFAWREEPALTVDPEIAELLQPWRARR